MKSKIEIVGIIPVKGYSQRVKRKNLRKFANTSLFELKLKQLSKTKNFKRFVVSSEDKRALDIANKHGFDIHFRDPYYSTSKVSMSEVYSYIASEINGENVAWINVTNPLCDHKIYDQAVQIYKKSINKFDCLLSAIEHRENFFYKKKTVNFSRSPWPRSQDLEPLISLPFVINILKKSDLIKWGSCVGKKPFFFILDYLIAKDIDNLTDFKICETMYKKKFNVK